MNKDREREQRLAEALRANLKRRKAQAREQAQGGDQTDSGTGDRPLHS